MTPGKIVALIFLFILIYILIGGFVVSGLCSDEKLHKFGKPEWSDSMFPPLKTTDDKFIFFTYWLVWPLMLCFYYIPKLIYIIGKFFVNYLGWIIAKIFRL